MTSEMETIAAVPEVIESPGSGGGELLAALLRARKNFKPVVKRVENTFFGSLYADLTECLDAVMEPLAEEGILLTQPVSIEASGRMVVRTLLIKGDEQISSSLIIPETTTDPQKIGAAISYFRRYGLTSLLALAVEDDDGNTASGKQSSPASARGVIAEGELKGRRVDSILLSEAKALYDYYASHKSSLTTYDSNLIKTRLLELKTEQTKKEKADESSTGSGGRKRKSNRENNSKRQESSGVSSPDNGVLRGEGDGGPGEFPSLGEAS